MRDDRILRHMARDLTGCRFHRQIKRSTKKQASRNARRLLKLDPRKVWESYKGESDD